MGKKILIAYSTNAGSTEKIAFKLGEVIQNREYQVDVVRIPNIRDISDYQAVIVGGPMIVGWHRQAKRFLKKHKKALTRIPLALFITAINLTGNPGSKLDEKIFYYDPRLIKSPRRPARRGFKEKYTSPDAYLRPMLKILKYQEPIGVGIFGGKLDYTKLSLLKMLFVMLIIQTKPGDFRNWEAIQGWGASIQSRLKEKLKPE